MGALCAYARTSGAAAAAGTCGMIRPSRFPALTLCARRMCTSDTPRCCETRGDAHTSAMHKGPCLNAFQTRGAACVGPKPQWCTWYFLVGFGEGKAWLCTVGVVHGDLWPRTDVHCCLGAVRGVCDGLWLLEAPPGACLCDEKKNAKTNGWSCVLAFFTKDFWKTQRT